MTNKALQLDPNDRDAIAVQGEAMVELGAVARAQQNLQSSGPCAANGCPQLARLANGDRGGPSVASAKPPEIPKKN